MSAFAHVSFRQIKSGFIVLPRAPRPLLLPRPLPTSWIPSSRLTVTRRLSHRQPTTQKIYFFFHHPPFRCYVFPPPPQGSPPCVASWWGRARCECPSRARPCRPAWGAFDDALFHSRAFYADIKRAMDTSLGRTETFTKPFLSFNSLDTNFIAMFTNFVDVSFCSLFAVNMLQPSRESIDYLFYFSVHLEVFFFILHFIHIRLHSFKFSFNTVDISICGC